MKEAVPSFRPRLHCFVVEHPVQSVQNIECYRDDGRKSLEELYRSYMRLSEEYGWKMEGLYSQLREVSGGGSVSIPVLSFHTQAKGPALWVLSGIHGEEPAGPNAIADNIDLFADLGKRGVPMVVIPLCNPKGYSLNWRFPNTADRTYKSTENPGGGVSVGDSDHLLPSKEDSLKPRRQDPVSPDAAALTKSILALVEKYPPQLVLDHHEDEQLRGPYVYEGLRVGDPVAQEVAAILRNSGMSMRDEKTRFGESICGGVVVGPTGDGSVDELLASSTIIIEGKTVQGPSAKSVITVETPTKRMDAHAAIFHELPALWNIVQPNPPSYRSDYDELFRGMR